MTDAEKIKKAADDYDSRLLGYGLAFVAGIEWRDQNPSEKVIALIEAIKESIARSDDYGDSHCSKPIREALASFRETNKDRDDGEK